MAQHWPKEEEKRAMDEIPSRKEFFELFKPQENGKFDVLGFEFEQLEVAQAKDFYAMCESMSIFYLPIEELTNFLDAFEVKNNLGARLALSLLMRQEDAGIFLMKEDDKRLIGVSKKKLRNSKWGVDLDSDLILPD